MLWQAFGRWGGFAAPVAGGGAGSVEYDTNESLAEQSTTSDTLTGGSITASLANGGDYLFLWTQDVQSSSSSSFAGSDVLVNGASIFSNFPSVLPRETGSPIDYQTMGGLFRHTASGASETFTVRGTRAVGAATLKLRNSRLSYIRMGANDQYTQSLGGQTFSDPANKTAQTAASLSFTPPSAGDYIVMASFLVSMTNSTNVSYGMELTDGTTTTGEVICRPPDTSDKCPMLLILPLSSISGSKTISLKVRQTGSGGTNIGVSEIRMVALRSDRFPSVHSVIAGSSSSGTEGSYTDTGATQTFTPSAGDYLTISAWQMGNSSTTVSAYSQYLDGADTVNEFIREYGAASANWGLGASGHRISTYTASSRKQVIQRRSEGTSNNQVQASAAIVTFGL